MKTDRHFQNEIYKGDCVEVLRDFMDETFELTVTSPPYDNLRTYNGNLGDWSFEKFKQVAKELYRVTKKGGVVVWIANDATIRGSETGTSFRQALYFKECGFNLHDTMIWEKISPFTHKNRYISSFEYMFIFSKGAPKTANLICDRKNKWGGTAVHGTQRLKADGVLRQNNGVKAGRKVKEYGARYNIWNIPGEKNNKTGHPAVFPVNIVYDHIMTWSKPGDYVLDPFMGSGTTGIACIKAARNFVGIEIDGEYFTMAKDRIMSFEKSHFEPGTPE